MASKYKISEASSGVNAARGPLGGLLSGLNAGFDDDNKNRFKASQELQKQRFQMAKMREQNMFNRETKTNFLSADQLLQQNRMNQGLPPKPVMPKAPKPPSLDELAALATGKFAGDAGKEMSLDDQIALIAELAKQKGFQPSGEKEVETGEKEGGFLGFGAKPVKRKVQTYSSSNQFQR